MYLQCSFQLQPNTAEFIKPSLPICDSFDNENFGFLLASLALGCTSSFEIAN